MGDRAEVLVIGAGPGGYAAAFRAADLGKQVTLISDEEEIGGVCLLRGCIPSKALLHLTEVIHGAGEARAMGIDFGEPKVDVDAVREWKDAVVRKLTRGLAGLCEKRGVRRIRARARFADSQSVELEGGEPGRLSFENAIIATGSRPISLPGTDIGGRIMDSAAALELADVPETLLVVGGGYVGLEMGMVYAALGSRVTLVEMADRLMPNADPDLVEPLAERVEEEFESVRLQTRVGDLEENDRRVRVSFEGEDGSREETYDRVLVAIGRRPNSEDLGLEQAGVETNERGFLEVDEQRRTSAEHIFAIGDVAGGMLLAHEAMREGKVAAGVIAGEPEAFDARAVPAVVYTDPQVAWCGLTEGEARAQDRAIEVVRFPWSASGRAVSMGLDRGLTKLVLEPQTQRVLGVGVVGRQAEALIAEGVLAVEMGAVARDLASSIHPHPTLSETIAEAAEQYLGGSPHLPGR